MASLGHNELTIELLRDISRALVLILIVWTANALQWRHNERDGVSNHQPHHCLLIRLFRRRSKKTSKLSVTGLCAGNSPVTGEFPAQKASNAENISIWWRNHGSAYIFKITDGIGYHSNRCGIAAMETLSGKGDTIMVFASVWTIYNLR